MSAELADLHLADLHERAAAAGIAGYRLLRREDLIERLAEVGVGAEGASDAGAAGARPRRRRGRRGGRGRDGRERERLPADEAAGGEAGIAEPEGREAETEIVTGVLELTRQRHGFLRVGGLTARDDDVYVSASQVRRCELRPGDEVSGPARAARRGERHRALVHVDSVNGGDPQEEGRATFDKLTPAPPSRRIGLAAEASAVARAADLLAPLAFGQRVLVRATPRAGRTTLLRDLARAIGGSERTRLVVLLIDERPEEVPAWRDALPDAELALAPADLAPVEQVRTADLALERARRAAEAGDDAILICDSLSRLAVAADGVAEVKRLFGSGRELAEEGAGSLTVIATAFREGDDEGSAETAVATTETALITLDASLAEEGIVPALRFAECRAEGAEHLLSDAEANGLRRLRMRLAELVPPEAAAYVREQLQRGVSNAEVLRGLA